MVSVFICRDIAQCSSDTFDKRISAWHKVQTLHTEWISNTQEALREPEIPFLLHGVLLLSMIFRGFRVFLWMWYVFCGKNDSHWSSERSGSWVKLLTAVATEGPSFIATSRLSQYLASRESTSNIRVHMMRVIWLSDCAEWWFTAPSLLGLVYSAGWLQCSCRSCSSIRVSISASWLQFDNRL